MQRYCSFTDYVYTFLLLQLSPKYLTTYNRTFVLQILLSMASLKCFLHSISKLIMVGREALVCTCCSVGWDGLRTAAQWLIPGVQLRAVCLTVIPSEIKWFPVCWSSVNPSVVQEQWWQLGPSLWEFSALLVSQRCGTGRISIRWQTFFLCAGTNTVCQRFAGRH